MKRAKQITLVGVAAISVAIGPLFSLPAFASQDYDIGVKCNASEPHCHSPYLRNRNGGTIRYPEANTSKFVAERISLSDFQADGYGVDSYFDGYVTNGNYIVTDDIYLGGGEGSSTTILDKDYVRSNPIKKIEADVCTIDNGVLIECVYSSPYMKSPYT